MNRFNYVYLRRILGFIGKIIGCFGQFGKFERKNVVIDPVLKFNVFV